jgi:two-component system nitrate/nitrite response regulator NarL
MFLKSLELAAHGFVTVSVTVRGETVQSPGGKNESALESAPLTEFETAAAAHAIAHRAAQARQVFERPEREPVPAFSPREASILQLLREGAPNKLIARQLSLTEATVKVHLKSILRKIRVNNRTQAAVWAMGQPTISNPPSK